MTSFHSAYASHFHIFIIFELLMISHFAISDIDFFYCQPADIASFLIDFPPADGFDRAY